MYRVAYLLHSVYVVAERMLVDMRKQIRDLEKVNSNYMRLLQKAGIPLGTTLEGVYNAERAAQQREIEKQQAQILDSTTTGTKVCALC